MMLDLSTVWNRILAIPEPRRTEAIRCFIGLYGAERIPKKEKILSESDASLKDACRYDLALFGKTFLPHWCPEDFNALHLDYYDQYKTRAGSRGHLDATAAPRGHSKTTGCVMLGIIHDCCYMAERVILYITNRAEHAQMKVRDIRDELESNTDIIRVFGNQVGDPWNQGEFMTAGGVYVMSAGRQSQVRGLAKKVVRFTKVCIDDVEHPDHVLNEEQREKTDGWLKNDILKLGQPRTNFEVWGTILHPDSMLKRLLSTPGWSKRHYRAVESFAYAESVPHWKKWRDIFIDLGNPTAIEDAKAYYDANKDVMLIGSKVLWPSRRDYYDLMVSRVREGESSFWQEMQGDPQHDARYLFQMDSAAYCKVTPSGIVRAGGHFVPHTEIVEVAAALDPTPDKKDARGSDYFSCPVAVRDKDGYIYLVDCYIKQEASVERQIEAVIDILWAWSVTTLAVEANGFASLLPGLLREAMARKGQENGDPAWHCRIVPIQNMRNKIQRIKTLEPMVANHWMQFSEKLSGVLIQQFRDFLPIDGAGHDDGPDSCEMVVRAVKGQYERRDSF